MVIANADDLAGDRENARWRGTVERRGKGLVLLYENGMKRCKGFSRIHFRR